MKTVVLLLVSFAMATPAMAFDNAANSVFKSGMASLCPGDNSDIKDAVCGITVGMSSVLTFSPVITMFVTADGTTKLSKGNMKLVLEAQEDASYFVASEGEVRTARLEVALRAFRQDNPQHQVSDFELAQWILAL